VGEVAVTTQIANASVWNGSAWVDAVGRSWYQNQPNTPTSTGTATVTANTSAHTKGAYAEVIASTSAAGTMLVLIFSGVQTSNANTATLVDIATGAAGSETIIIPNIAIGGSAQSAVRDIAGVALTLPVNIPAGTRLSARIQSVVTGGKTAGVEARVYSINDPSLTATTLTTLAADTATSQGLSLAGASGSYTQVIASTAAAYSALAISPSVHNSVIPNNHGVYTVATGAAGSEVDIGTIECFNWSSEGVASVATGTYTVFPVTLPAGSRVAVKHNIASNPDRYGVSVIGVPA
jgi:hypothetical protein